MFVGKNHETAYRTDVLEGFCYRPANQDEEAEEIFCTQLGEVSLSLAIVLMGVSNFIRCLPETEHSGEEAAESMGQRTC